MTAEDFDRYLRRRLCWIDGAPTHASSARQRQCPHCRRKWSYDRLRMRWEAAVAFAGGKPRGECAEEHGIDIHTAGRLYAQMEDRLVDHFASELAGSSAGEMADGEEMMEVWRRTRKLRTRRALHRHLVELGLRHRTLEERVELVFQLCFREQLRRSIIRRMALPAQP